VDTSVLILYEHPRWPHAIIGPKFVEKGRVRETLVSLKKRRIFKGKFFSP